MSEVVRPHSEVVRPSPAAQASAEPHSKEQYTDRALEHLTKPRNAGTLPDPSGTGADANPSCGDRTVITVAISDGHVQAIRAGIDIRVLAALITSAGGESVSLSD